MPKVNHHRAGLLMAQHKEFDSGNLTGQQYPNGTRDWFASGWSRDINVVSPGSTYVVWSYGTPIAWVDKYGCAHYSGQRYSVTTSGHQSIARAYLRDADRASAYRRKLAAKANEARRAEQAADDAARRRAQRVVYNARRRQQRADERERLLLVAQLAADENAAKQSIISALEGMSA